jgi:DNA helicase-2/ATP-dependent DNA helicase PcrA
VQSNFGKYHIPVDYVYNWTAPAGRLFYNPQDGGYTSETGKVIKGTVQLKRDLLIEEAKLQNITDYALLPPGARPELEVQAALTRQLAKSKSSELQDIVATIQPTQYQQIIAALQQVMIIQGVAGSGKSEVGLHRVA